MPFELNIIVLSGLRKDHHIILHNNIDIPIEHTPYILEDELLEFQLIAPKVYSNAALKVYQHVITPSEILHINDNLIKFIWKPNNYNYTERLFINYFGISELAIDLSGEDISPVEIRFQPLQILAKTESIKNVEEMFTYLSKISPQELYSVFSATKSHGKIESDIEGSPLEFIERLKYSENLLLEILPSLIHTPITRLEPQHKFVHTTGTEELNESSISWLMENLSVLEPDENLDQAHICYDNQHYRASTMYIPVLSENTDVYENQVIHGFIDLLIRESLQLLHRYLSNDFTISSQFPTGYTSFFEKMNKFKKVLISNEINTINECINSLRTIQIMLNKHLPVTKTITQRPIFTPKVKVNYIYRNIFIEIVNWLEKKSINWSSFDNLFAINSLSFLFETYCYFRVVTEVNFLLSDWKHIESSLQLEFYNEENNIELKIEKEPSYWTTQHTNKHKDNIVNSEGFTIGEYQNLSPRGQMGKFSKRQPDLVIQFKQDNITTLLVMDAKYTRKKTAFTKYLPELTMKYIHGIHKYQQSEPTVISLTIMYPSEKKDFLSYHHQDMSIFGKHPVTPNIQTIGLILGEKRTEDTLSEFIKQLFTHHGIIKESI